MNEQHNGQDGSARFRDGDAEARARRATRGHGGSSRRPQRRDASARAGAGRKGLSGIELLERRVLLANAVDATLPDPWAMPEGGGVVTIDWRGQKAEARAGEFVVKLDNVKG